MKKYLCYVLVLGFLGNSMLESVSVKMGSHKATIEATLNKAGL